MVKTTEIAEHLMRLKKMGQRQVIIEIRAGEAFLVEAPNDVEVIIRKEDHGT